MFTRVVAVAMVSVAPAALAQPAHYGFESSEGFALGAIGGQQGWTEFDVSAGAGADVVEIDGRRALRLGDNPAAPNGVFVGALSPEVFDPGERGVFTADVRIDDLAG